MDKEFYMKFPSVFREALVSKIVSFDEDPETSFETFKAYRGIFRKNNKPFVPLDKTDFESQAEKSLRLNNNEQRNNRREINDKLGFYSCSVFTDINDISAALKFPQNDRCIVEGPVSDENGCIRHASDNSHVDWWLYEKTGDFWNEYKVV